MPWFEAVLNSRWEEQFGLVLLQLTMLSKYPLFPENGQKQKQIYIQIDRYGKNSVIKFFSA